ncbi:MAG TPA: hypothetical protein VGK22_20580 [Candidatus Angelobacter sp.]|jgi:hypothetical protein
MMTTRNLFRCTPIIALALGVAVLPAALRAQDAPSASPSIQEQLEAQYPLAKMTTKGGCTVTNPETGLALQKAGPAALPQRSSSLMCASHYRNGNFTKPGFKCTYFLNMTKQELVTLEKGDKVFPTKLEVDKDDVKVSFGYCSGDQGQAAAYTGQVIIEFPKDSLKAASVAQIEDKMAEVLSADSGDQQAQGGGQQSGPNSQPQDSQPQDNQSACNPEVGQTVDQVVAACGQPVNQSKGASTKLIYFYNQPKLKIIFMNGKVSDTE